MNRTALSLSLALTIAAGASPALAGSIVTRHDRDDAAYKALGERYTCTANVGGGTGTLVHPRWVITAAHVAQGLGPFSRTVRFGDEQRTIDKVFFHPSWKGQLESPEETLDIALVRLDAPVTSVDPVGVYRGGDEVGMTIVFVGRGDTGDGERGVTHGDGELRGAHNVVDAVEFGQWLVFDFDSPPDGLELEGISGPGDSGGPALAEIDGKLFTLGVSSANDSPSGVHCAYESSEYYARVSAAGGWLEETMREQLDTPGDALVDVVDLTKDAWPQTRPAACARALFEAFNAGDAEAIARFERDFRGDADGRGRSVADRVGGWMELVERWGEQEPVRLASPGPGSLDVETESEDRTRSWSFEFDDADPPMLMGVRIAG